MNDKPVKSGGLFGALRRAVSAPAQAREEGAVPAVPQTATVQPDAPANKQADKPANKQGWLQRLKAGLTKTSARLATDLGGIVPRRRIELEVDLEREPARRSVEREQDAGALESDDRAHVRVGKRRRPVARTARGHRNAARRLR